jgi:SSS family solute:Na+ symporter
MNATTLIIFVVFFAFVTVLGFVAARWHGGGNLSELHEWGLGGRRFGTWVTWFLLGGDLYTAYTFVAVPAQVFGQGAIGFFAVPYTIIVYPFVFMVMPRLWSVAKQKGYITAADFVRGRYGGSGLALAVAFTGILATMPYIALQLVGMEVVFQTMGLTGSGVLADLPLIIAFAILAAYTYQSGLRAPALIAFVKDLMIYVTVLTAVIYIPIRLGGFGHVFQVAATVMAARKPAGSILLSPKAFTAFATLAFGSAMALFLYPHSVTGVLSSKSRDVVERNAALLPAYSLVLGLIALLGYMAIAAGITIPKGGTPSLAVPLLFQKMFPSWFTGFAFAAVAIGALVPAAIMSIAAANLFTRNIYREFFRPDCTPEQEAGVAKTVSLVVKLGALAFILFLPLQYAINLQLLGGVWILQTFPAVIVGLYTQWLDRRALTVGWAAGMAVGTWMAIALKFTSSVYPLHIGGMVVPTYAAVSALVVNLAVSVVLTAVLRAAGAGVASDETVAADYEVTGSMAGD